MKLYYVWLSQELHFPGYGVCAKLYPGKSYKAFPADNLPDHDFFVESEPDGEYVPAHSWELSTVYPVQEAAEFCAGCNGLFRISDLYGDAADPNDCYLCERCASAEAELISRWDS